MNSCAVPKANRCKIDPEFVTVILDSCENYKDGRLSSPCIVSDNNEKHCMTQSAAKHCNLRPDQYGDVSLTYCVKGNTEPATVLCQVVPDDQEEADIVFSRKAFYAEKNKNSSTTLLGGTYNLIGRGSMSLEWLKFC